MTVKQILIKARELVAAGWAQGTWAHDAEGAPVPAFSPRAVCFCTVGAITRASRGKLLLRAEARAALESLISGMLIDWNDAELRTQEEVLALFERAIEHAA